MQLLCDKMKKEHGLNWAKGFMDHLLKNNFYRGTMEWKGVKYPHKYPPIISNTLFEQVNQVKASFNKKPAKFAGLPYIYRGLLRCSDCGLAITPEKHKGFVYYHCTQYNGKHGAKWLREEEITRQLAEVFKSMQIPKDIVKEMEKTLADVHQQKAEFHGKEFDELTKEQKQLTKMMDNLYLDKLKGSITDSAYDRFYQTLRDQLNEVTTRFSKLQEAEDNYYVTAKYVLDLTNRAYDLFVSSEVEERRQLIKLVLSNLRLDGEKVLYDAIKPFDSIIKFSNDQAWCAQQDSNLQPTVSKTGTLSFELWALV